jgi:DNA-binding NarL/FixJ family response regulator
LVEHHLGASHPKAEKGDPAPLRVLIADDHEVVRKGVCFILATRGSLDSYTETTNGRDAVQKALLLNPDLIILDIGMPELDGLSAATQIKRLLPHIPILILSMHRGQEMVRASQLAGAQGYITKSDATGSLLKAVDALLQNQTFFPEHNQQSHLSNTHR